jgi:hypothetical protein
MVLITNALSALTTQGFALLRLLAVFTVGALLTFGLLRRGLKDYLSPAETFVLALAGWPLFWLFSALPAFFINRALDLGPNWAVFLLTIFGLLLVYSWKKLDAPFGKPGWLLFVLALVFCLSLFTRLAFLADLVVPSYFDGALHYAISQNLLTQFGTWPWQGAAAPLDGYYHLGFHLLTAVFAAFWGMKINQVILLLGQILLAVIPFPVFFMLQRETESAPAAFFALFLAGWGWSMPAYALNWGKYPALAGLLALQFVLALAYFATRPGLPTKNKLFLTGLLLAGIIFSALMHTRTLIVLALVFLSYLAASYWAKLENQRTSFTLLALIVAGLFGLVVYLQSRDILKLVFDPYLRVNTWWLTGLVIVLGPFAFKQSARLALTSLLTLSLLLVCLLIPVPLDAFQTLLDRPFVQMLLYLPLAWLGGLGLAGLLGMFRDHPKGKFLLTVAAFGLVLIQMALNYNFSPSACCILFKPDDAVALEMLKQNLPEAAQVLIAGNTLNVFDIENPSEQHGSDGGIWITPLTGRKTLVRHFSTDFGARATLSDVCEHGISYIYVGGTQESFSLDQLQAQPEQYAVWLSLPGAHLFQVVSCP